MTEIEVTTNHEALAALIAPVESDGEILLTRHGRTIARIIPASQNFESHPNARTSEQQARVKEAMQNIRDLRDELKLDPFDFEQFKVDRDEGRL